MSVRSAARGNPAAKSIRFALRTSSIVATSSANFSRCVLRWLGSRRLRSALMLSAIRVRPSTTQVLGPLKAKSLNQTPTPAVNPDLSEIDGWQAVEPIEVIEIKAEHLHDGGGKVVQRHPTEHLDLAVQVRSKFDPENVRGRIGYGAVPHATAHSSSNSSSGSGYWGGAVPTDLTTFGYRAWGTFSPMPTTSTLNRHSSP